MDLFRVLAYTQRIGIFDFVKILYRRFPIDDRAGNVVDPFAARSEKRAQRGRRRRRGIDAFGIHAVRHSPVTVDR